MTRWPEDNDDSDEAPVADSLSGTGCRVGTWSRPFRRGASCDTILGSEWATRSRMASGFCRQSTAVSQRNAKALDQLREAGATVSALVGYRDVIRQLDAFPSPTPLEQTLRLGVTRHVIDTASRKRLPS